MQIANIPGFGPLLEDKVRVNKHEKGAVDNKGPDCRRGSAGLSTTRGRTAGEEVRGFRQQGSDCSRWRTWLLTTRVRLQPRKCVRFTCTSLCREHVRPYVSPAFIEIGKSPWDYRSAHTSFQMARAWIYRSARTSFQMARAWIYRSARTGSQMARAWIPLLWGAYFQTHC